MENMEQPPSEKLKECKDSVVALKTAFDQQLIDDEYNYEKALDDWNWNINTTTAKPIKSDFETRTLPVPTIVCMDCRQQVSGVETSNSKDIALKQMNTCIANLERDQSTTSQTMSSGSTPTPVASGGGSNAAAPVASGGGAASQSPVPGASLFPGKLVPTAEKSTTDKGMGNQQFAIAAGLVLCICVCLCVVVAGIGGFLYLKK